MSQHRKFQDEIELASKQLTTPIITVHKPDEVDPIKPLNPFEDEISTSSDPIDKKCAVEEILIIASNIVSIVLGIFILSREELKFLPFDWLSFYFVISFSTIFCCFLLAFIICFLFTIYKLIRRLPNPGSPFALLPLLYLFWFYANYIMILVMGIFFLVDQGPVLKQDFKIYIVFHSTIGGILILGGFCRIFCLASNSFSAHLLELEKDAYEINKDEVEQHRGEVKRQIALYNDKLKLKIPTLSKEHSEAVVISQGEYKTPDDVNLSINQSRSAQQNTRSPESIRFDPQSSQRMRDSTRKRSPLKLYKV